MKNLIFTIAISIAGCLSASAQNFSKVDAWLDKNAAEMGGRLMLVIAQDGKIVHQYSVHEMDARQKMAAKLIARRANRGAGTEEYTLSTRQPIASCSKWLSAALTMTFVDEGKLKLTDTVGKFIPALSKSGKGKITISQCLSHMTGVDAPSLKESLEEKRNNTSMDDAMDDIAKMPMEGEPGKVFHYSNVGLQIAGAVIEKITGKTFQELFAERITKPLQMKGTDWGSAKVALPAGGALSTPQDYSNFLTMILNKGTFNGKRILNEASVAQMQVNRVTPDVKVAYSPAEAGGLGYGFGEWMMGGGTVSSPGLFGSFPWVNNDKNYSGFLMAFYINSKGRGERYRELKQLVDEALAK
ncbi:serine hydrolase domain-containing protein [Mucilaginibacter myungsuensis]|uniref:Beta-lactamase family protein n=1 Tax=Mucilaginibacter myungsuensis TaxID=649104 RepID=A0A929L1P1_9SPHI|nr:serine hydrolase domain-containing protein [Mucilaginibacter myungsuensis]MBE9664630.1 beta-lactamase family protein [Mucilaginibacter myungsuensis]MDN3601479.1 serine hydrolase domain-containing protein [Mucilaginibacter myungsuensis]